MPAITTTAEILLEPITNFGASQLTQTRKHSNVLCPFAPLSKCFTFPLTMAGNLTSIIPSHLHLFRKKTFLLRSQYVFHLWWNSGELTKVLPYAFFLTAKKLFLLLDNKNKRWLYVELFAARKKMFAISIIWMIWTSKKRLNLKLIQTAEAVFLFLCIWKIFNWIQNMLNDWSTIFHKKSTDL